MRGQGVSTVTSQPACTFFFFLVTSLLPGSSFCEPTGDLGQSCAAPQGMGNTHTFLVLLKIPTDDNISLPFVFMSIVGLFCFFR